MTRRRTAGSPASPRRPPVSRRRAGSRSRAGHGRSRRASGARGSRGRSGGGAGARRSCDRRYDEACSGGRGHRRLPAGSLDHRHGDELARCVELAQDALELRPDGQLHDDVVPGDLRRRPAEHDLCEHVDLTTGQVVEAPEQVPPRVREDRALQEVRTGLAGDDRADDGADPRHAVVDEHGGDRSGAGQPHPGRLVRGDRDHAQAAGRQVLDELLGVDAAAELRAEDDHRQRPAQDRVPHLGGRVEVLDHQGKRAARGGQGYVEDLGDEAESLHHRDPSASVIRHAR